jgi:hypothetical protein
MKVYIVEMFGYNGTHRYGVYSNIELAKNKLKEIFEEEKERYSKYGNNYKVEWSKFTKNSFNMQYRDKTQEYYEVTEVEVEDGNN